MTKVERKALRSRAEALVARYATQELSAVMAVAEFLTGNEQKIDKVPPDLQIWFDAAKEDGDVDQLASMLDHDNPRIALRGAKALLKELDKIEKGQTEADYESILDICLTCWKNGSSFPSTPHLPKEAREFAKDLWACRKKKTGLFDIQGSVRFIEKYFKIKDKKANIIPFRLNEVQRKYAEFLDETLQKEGWDDVHIFILKARREGFSTFILALDFVYQLVHPFKDKSIIAHKKSESDEKGALTEFWNILQLFWKSLPYAPKKDGEGGISSGLKFDRDGLGSTTSFLSAGAREIARGTNNNLIHLSEFGFYPENLWSRTRNAVMASAEGALFLAQYETTANGLNHAYDLWNEAGNLGIHKFFAPWFWMPEYRKVPPQEWNCPADVERYFNDRPYIYNYFKELRFAWEKRKIVMDALKYWVFLQVSRKFQGDWTSFYQEFPSSPMEAFQGSGAHYFEPALMQKIQSGVKNPEFIGEIHFDPEMVNRDLEKEPPKTEDVRLLVDGHGPFRIFKQPENDHEYIVGVDACSGESSQSDPDMGAIIVRDRWTGEFVAEWVAAVRPEELAMKAIACAVYYQGSKGAIVNWEVNGHGHAMTPVLVDNRKLCGYRLYRRKVRDRKTRKIEERYGFYTSGGSRVALLLSSLRDDIVSNAMSPHWRILNNGLLLEMSTLGRAKTGKWEADSGRHDDRIFAASLTVVADRDARQPTIVVEEKKPEKAAQGEVITIQAGFEKAMKNANRQPGSGRLPKAGGMKAWR